MSRPWYRREIGEPLSWLIGILSTAIALEGLRAFSLSTYVSIYSYYIVGVVIGMVIHELMHRNVARRYGLRSRYVVNPLGVIITLITTPLPFKIIAPGYTSVYSLGLASPWRERRGFAASVVAGPLSNMVLSTVTLIAGGLLALAGSPASIMASQWLIGFSWVNAYLAFFNLLPIPPLDGSKVFRFSVILWGILFVISIALLIVASIL
ncbi:MAG: site-2 protease family protein [Acidilobus sp.]